MTIRNSLATGQLDMSSDDYPVMVLLVDDQVIVGEAIRRALANQPDISFHYCADPAVALATAAEIEPTVILQDLVMPGVDGLALVREYRMHPKTRPIPIIVLSSKDEPTVKSDAFGAGANDYIVKLPDKIELLARVRHHSKAYVNQRQRDAAYVALRESQQQLLQLNLELQRLNRVDGLTGLSNRRYLDEILALEWRRAVREQTCLSVLMIDIDDFKRYNDTYGHLAGDAALKLVAEALRECLKRPADLAARFGGEEFTAILPGVPLAGAGMVGDQIRLAVSSLAIAHSGSTIGSHLTVSIGGAGVVPRHDSVCAQLVDIADRALYEAKRDGKNRVVTLESQV